MPFVCVAKSESSCESRPVPVPAVSQKQILIVRPSATEENSEQSRLTEALRQREKVWQWIANVQQTVSRRRQPSLEWLIGVRNDLWTAYAKFNELHSRVIVLAPDDVIDEQTEVYRQFEAAFFKVASSIEEMKLEIQRPKPVDPIPYPSSETSSISANPVASSTFKWDYRSLSAETQEVPVPTKKPIDFQALRPQTPPVGKPRSNSLRDNQFSIPSNDSQKGECLLTPHFSKRCYATYERPSLFFKAVPRHRQDTGSAVHNRTQERTSSEKQTKLIVVVSGKSTAAAEDVATNAILQSLAPNVIVCPNPPDVPTIGLPTSDQKRHQRDKENSSCVPGDSSVKVKVLSLANHDLRADYTDGVSKKMMPVPAEAPKSPKDYRVSQDGGPSGEKDPLLPPVVKAPDKIDQLHITPSDYQPRNSCIPLECHQLCTNRAISRNPISHSICQAIREHVCITLKLFVASSLKKLCRTDVPNQLTCNDIQPPTRSLIVQPSLKDGSYSDHSRSHASHEFHNPRKKQALEAPYAFSRKNHSNAHQPRIYWIDPDEPSNNYETGTPLAENDTISRILIRPWDPGTNSPTSVFTIVHIIVC